MMDLYLVQTSSGLWLLVWRDDGRLVGHGSWGDPCEYVGWMLGE